jgi:hypothetical protein
MRLTRFRTKALQSVENIACAYDRGTGDRARMEVKLLINRLLTHIEGNPPSKRKAELLKELTEVYR